MSSNAAEKVAPGLRVIEPKLMPPRVHPGMLRREGLLERLDDGGGAALTVLSAAVGYGKTSLARSWCTERPEPVIWLTLDAADGDPVRLRTHLATRVGRLERARGRPAARECASRRDDAFGPRHRPRTSARAAGADRGPGSGSGVHRPG